MSIIPSIIRFVHAFYKIILILFYKFDFTFIDEIIFDVKNPSLIEKFIVIFRHEIIIVYFFENYFEFEFIVERLDSAINQYLIK